MKDFQSLMQRALEIRDSPQHASEEASAAFMERRRQLAEEARRERAEESIRRRVTAAEESIPPLYRSWTWNGSPAATEAVTRIRELFGSNLIIIGPTGTGKSGLGVTAVKDVAEKHAPARYTWFPSIVRRLRDSYRDGAEESAGEILDRLVSVPWLLLDDLGAEARVTDLVREAVHELIHERQVNERPTWVTTNLPWTRSQQADGRAVDGIRELYGERTLDRLRDYHSLVLTGATHRGEVSK